MSEEAWIDVAAAAARHRRSTYTIWRWIKAGELAARKEKSIGRNGRRVVKTWVRVGDLDRVFGVTAHDEHVRRIRATARPFTDEQKVAIRKVFLEHLLEREAMRKMGKSGGRAAL